MAAGVDGGQGRIRFTFKDTANKILVGFAAIFCIGAAPKADETPMLWNTHVELVSEKSNDGRRVGKWFDRRSEKLCISPFRPKVGVIQKDGSNCRYTRVSKRGSKIFRKVTCDGDPSRSFETVIRGTETADSYNNHLVTTLRDDNGKIISVTEMLETGRRIGECPEGMNVTR
jgi:Protein of unknown function (DUF3617)